MHPFESLVGCDHASLAWALEHAPGGSIEALWHECDDPELLLRVYGLTGDVAGVVRVAYAVALSAKPLNAPLDMRSAALIRTVQRMIERCMVVDLWFTRQETMATAVNCVRCAQTLLLGTYLKGIYTYNEGVCTRMEGVYEVALNAYEAAAIAYAGVVTSRDRMSFSRLPSHENRDAQRRLDLASLVRATVACPSLGALAVHEP